MNSSEQDISERVGVTVRDVCRTVVAPHSLRASLAERRLAHGRRPRRGFLALGAGGAVVVAVVAALVIATAGDSRPGVDQAATFGLQRVALPAPTQKGRFLDASVGSVRFPNYDYALAPVGAREDRIDGRRAATVVYSDGSTRVGYTVVDGRLAVPDDARRVTYMGVDAAVFRRGGALVVTWERDGKTCVLASRDADERLLLGMASWT